MNGFRNTLWPPRLHINKYPVGFASGNELVVIQTEKGVPPHGANPAHVVDPGNRLYPVALKGRPQVLDVVGARHPGGPVRLVHGLPANRVPVLHGKVLHPLDVLHVVDVAIPIDRFFVHRKGVAEPLWKAKFLFHDWIFMAPHSFCN